MQMDKGSAVVIAPSALLDHIVTCNPNEMCLSADEVLGGSKRMSRSQMRALKELLSKHNLTTIPAGSAANVARNLAHQGCTVKLSTCCGDDEPGRRFQEVMAAAGVDVSNVITLPGVETSQSLIMSYDGGRTMRTYINPDATLKPDMIAFKHLEVHRQGNSNDHQQSGQQGQSGQQHPEHEQPQQLQERGHTELCRGDGETCIATTIFLERWPHWAFLSGYSYYSPGLLPEACKLALQARRRVFLDLASFEVVGAHGSLMCDLITDPSLGVDVCVCNEDEATALAAFVGRHPQRNPSLLMMGHSTQPDNDTVEQQGFGLTTAQLTTGEFLGHNCRHMAIVTLGKRGCMLFGQAVQGRAVLVQGVQGVTPVDATGAGDAFSGAVLYALMQGWDPIRCAEHGCAAGAGAVQVLGPDLGTMGWAEVTQNTIL